MDVFSADSWAKTKEALLEGLFSPSRFAMVESILEAQAKTMEAQYIACAPQREFNAARKQRIQKIRIKRNLVNRRRKALGLKPYRPRIIVFAKPKRTMPDSPMIRRVIPGCIAFDIKQPETPLNEVVYLNA